MGKRPYKIRKYTPKVPTCWQQADNIHVGGQTFEGQLDQAMEEDNNNVAFQPDHESLVDSEEISATSKSMSSPHDPPRSCASSICSSTSNESDSAPPKPYLAPTTDDTEHDHDLYDIMVETDHDYDLPPPETQFVHSPNESGFIPGPGLCLGIELLNMCSHAKVPLGFYDQVLRLFKNYAKRHSNEDHQVACWNSIPSTREKLLNELKVKIPCVQPHSYAVTSTNDIVPKFPFMDQLLDLLATPHFQDIGSCCFNVDEKSRFLKYQPSPDEGLSELMGAQWYQETYDMRIGDSPSYVDPQSGETYHNLLCPIVFYNDKISVSAMEGSYSLEPLMFTVGLLRREVREKESSWRHLGFIPCKSDKKKLKGVAGKEGEQALAFNHQCLSILLEDLVTAQKDPPLLNLNFFGRSYKVRLILEVAFVIGDQLSQDTHCCRKKSNSGGAARIHRSCLMSFVGAKETPQDYCKPIPKKVLDYLSAVVWQYEDVEKRNAYILEKLPPVHTKKSKKKLSSLMQQRSLIARDILEKVFTVYPVHNAWSSVSFGANLNGIHVATVDDPMHYNASGLFSYLGKIAFGGLLPSEAETLERYIREDFSVRSSVRYDLPRGKFSPGFTNCTLLTSNEKVGIIYALYLSLGTPRVANLYQTSILRQQQKYLDLSVFATCPEATLPSEKVSCPQPTRIPNLEDQYFFKNPSNPMPRTISDVRKRLESLNTLGLLSCLEEVIPHFDELQVEYLLQIVWDRLGSKDLEPLFAFDPYQVHLSYPEVRNRGSMTRFSNHCHKQLRQEEEEDVPIKASKRSSNSVSPVIQNRIKKHWYKKQKVKGNGSTSCILTDLKGFCDVLHAALVFYAFVHEFHELDAKFHSSLNELKAKLDGLLTGIYSRIYRGDDSVDTRTCKCHAHFHLISAIQYYGAPMGYDAGKGERNLKFWAKEMSKTAQKCGQSIFIEQTSKRVSDYLVIQQAHNMILSDQRLRSARQNTAIPPPDDLPSWVYTRTAPHMVYNIEHRHAEMIKYNGKQPPNPSALLTTSIQNLLQELHGPTGDHPSENICIWKEIKLCFGQGKGHHFVRAFHDLDSYGRFFDWVQVKVDNPEDDDAYRPAKALLLYQTEDKQDLALVWMAQRATAADLRLETNISARWKMDLVEQTGLPQLVSISMEDIKKTIVVYEHWKCINNNHLPSTELANGENLWNTFVVDESYDRYSWCLNFVDPDRW